MKSITMFTKNQCHRCDASKRYLLNKLELGDYLEIINVQEDENPRDEFDNKTPLNYVIENYSREMPVIVFREEDGSETWWSGMRPEKMREIANKITA